MAIRKCSRCELNYILDEAAYCPVCMREMKGDKGKEAVLDTCSICNENPALPGRDLCLFCLKEMEGAEAALLETEPGESSLELDDATDMEEIGIDSDDDDEFSEINEALSLEDVLAEEGDGDLDDEEDEGL